MLMAMTIVSPATVMTVIADVTVVVLVDSMIRSSLRSEYRR